MRRSIVFPAALTALVLAIGAPPVMADDDGGDVDAQGRLFTCKPQISLHLNHAQTQVTVTAEPDDRWYGIDLGLGPDADAVPDPAPTPEPSLTQTPAPTPGATSPSTPASTASGTAAGSAAIDARSVPMKGLFCARKSSTVTVRNEDTGEETSYTLHSKDTDRRALPMTLHGGQRIVATIEQGHGEDRARVTTHATAPTEPRDLIVPRVTETTATVDWKKPAFDGGKAVTGYRVWIDSTLLPDTTVTSVLLTGLAADTDHTVSVGAVNSVAMSQLAVAHFRTRPQTTVPGKPGDPRSTSTSTTTVTLQWRPPTNTGGLPITGYQVTSDTTNVELVTGTTATVRRLAPGTLHHFAVQAINDNGPGLAATTSVWTDMDPVPTPLAPGAPRDVTLTATSGSTMVVSWTAPKKAGSTPISRYVVDIAGTSYDVTQGTSLTVAGLTSGTRYEAKVWAWNSKGPGPAAVGSGWTHLVPITKPVTRPSEPRGFGETATSQTTITLAWKKPQDDGGEPVSAYLLSWGEGRAAYVVGTDQSVTGLEAGTLYRFELRALNSAGSSEPASISVWTDMKPVLPPVVPDPPRHLSAPMVAKTTMLLTWDAPASDGGTPVEWYLVSWAPGQALITPGRSVLIERLSPGTLYDVSVVAHNVMGNSGATTLGVRTVYEPVVEPTAPSVPRDLRVLGTTDQSVLLDWSRPSSDGGNPITGYAVFVNDVFRGHVDNTSAAVEGLTADMEYAFVVRAVNAMGWSDPATVTARTHPTPAPGPGPAPAPRPDPITPPIPAGTPDTDGDPGTHRQTVAGAWPKVATLRPGTRRLVERTPRLVTNAGQNVTLAVTYRSPSIASTSVSLDRRTGGYYVTADLRPGAKSGAVILTATAPAARVDGKRYASLRSSKRFIVRPAAAGPR